MVGSVFFLQLSGQCQPSLKLSKNMAVVGTQRITSSDLKRLLILANLTNAEIDLKVANLLAEIADLREELQIVETDTEDRFLRQILSTFLRRMITRANAQLRDLVRLRQQRQN